MFSPKGLLENSCTLINAKGTDEVVMKKTVLTTTIIAMLLLSHLAQAGVSIVINGSFEYDDRSIDYITEQDAPYRWCDVNLPEFKFVGALWSGGSATHGNYYVDIYSNDWGTFDVNDMGTISQQVYLQDVNEIIFDLTLDTWPDDPWDPNQRSPVLLIDDDEVEVVWDPNMVGSDLRGSYEGHYIVAEKYKDVNSHKLSLGLKVNLAGELDTEYHTEWDFIKFDTYCGGLGYLSQDFNFDCYVDMNDLRLLVGVWLVEEPSQMYDLFEDGIVDFRDFAIFTEYWMANTYWENWGDKNCYEMELLASDLNYDGIVNLVDFVVLAKSWMKQGNCISCDIDNSGAVDYKDLSIISDEWLLTNWLYGLK